MASRGRGGVQDPVRSWAMNLNDPGLLKKEVSRISIVGHMPFPYKKSTLIEIRFIFLSSGSIFFGIRGRHP